MTESAYSSPDQDGWLTIKEAAEYLKVSEQTIFRWMRSGKVSFFKFGNSTRFRRSNLDMVAEKFTGEAEGALAAGRCAVCGHSKLVRGRLRSTGRIYFQPEHARFFVLSEGMVSVEAQTCPACGSIQLFADAKRLARLLRQENGMPEEMEGDPEAAEEE